MGPGGHRGGGGRQGPGGWGPNEASPRRLVLRLGLDAASGGWGGNTEDWGKWFCAAGGERSWTAKLGLAEKSLLERQGQKRGRGDQTWRDGVLQSSEPGTERRTAGANGDGGVRGVGEWWEPTPVGKAGIMHRGLAGPCLPAPAAAGSRQEEP